MRKANVAKIALKAQGIFLHELPLSKICGEICLEYGKVLKIVQKNVVR